MEPKVFNWPPRLFTLNRLLLPLKKNILLCIANTCACCSLALKRFLCLCDERLTELGIFAVLCQTKIQCKKNSSWISGELEALKTKLHALKPPKPSAIRAVKRVFRRMKFWRVESALGAEFPLLWSHGSGLWGCVHWSKMILLRFIWEELAEIGLFDATLCLVCGTNRHV